MAKRTKRTTRLASVALLGTTVFANPPPKLEKAPPDVIVNRPNPAYDPRPVDAGTSVTVAPSPPAPRVTINRMPVPMPEQADAGVRELKKK